MACKKGGVVRFTVDLNRAYYEKFTKLRDFTIHKTRSGLFRRALDVYDALALHCFTGGKVILRNKSGSERELTLGLSAFKSCAPRIGEVEGGDE